jgi:hypothetical protein
VSGPLTDTELRASAVPVSGPLTDTQLRATAVPVSLSGSVPVTGTFWQTTQPVSLASAPLPTGAATETTLSAIDAALPDTSEGTLLSSAVRNTTTTSSEQTNARHRGLLIFWDVTAVTAGQTVQPQIQAKDPVSGQWVTVMQGNAQSGAGVQGFLLYPGHTTTIAGFGNVTQASSASLPRTWRLRVAHSGGGNWTYSAGFCLLP